MSADARSPLMLVHGFTDTRRAWDPDADWLELPGCGHLAQHDDPQLIARVVREWVAEPVRPGGGPEGHAAAPGRPPTSRPGLAARR